MRQILQLGWNIARIEKTYQDFVKRWSPVEQALPVLDTLSAIDAMALRVILIYEFRRCCLSHPVLPLEFSSNDWISVRARQIVARIWRKLLDPTERWLTQNAKRHDGDLTEASRDLGLRFLS